MLSTAKHVPEAGQDAKIRLALAVGALGSIQPAIVRTLTTLMLLAAAHNVEP